MTGGGGGGASIQQTANMIFYRCAGLQVQMMIIFLKYLYLIPGKLACNKRSAESLASNCRIPDKGQGADPPQHLINERRQKHVRLLDEF